MPLDSRIIGSGQRVPFNNPFEALAAGRQHQQAQQAQQQAQAEQSALRGQQFQQNAQALQAGQVEADELQAYKAAIGNPDLTPESLLDEIRVKAPGKYEAARGRFDAHQQNILQTKQLKQQLQTSTKAWIGGHLDDIANSDYSPLVAEATLKMIETEEPDFAPQAAQIREQLLSGGKPALKALVDSMRPKAPTKDGFTLSEGQTRFNASGEPIAEGGAKPAAEPASLEAMLVQAIKAKDGPAQRSILNSIAQKNAAGRAPEGAGSRMWVMRDGQAVRVSEGEIRPGDAPASTREAGTSDRGQLVQAVLANPSLWDDLTPTEKGRIAPALHAEGYTGFGKALPQAAVAKVAGVKSAVDNLKDLKTAMKDNEQYMGPVAGLQRLNPYSDARKLQAKVDVVRQRVGKSLEEGVLRKEDEEKYKLILAEMSNTPELAYSKIDGLVAMMENDIKNYLNEQRLSGRRVTTAVAGRTGDAPAPAGAKKIGRFEIVAEP